MVANLQNLPNTQDSKGNKASVSLKLTSIEATFKQLKALPKPQIFDGFNISPAQVAESLNTALSKLKYPIRDEKYIVSRDGMRMAGLISFEKYFHDCYYAIAFSYSLTYAVPLYLRPAYLMMGSGNPMIAGKYIAAKPATQGVSALATAIQSSMKVVEERYPLMFKRTTMWKRTVIPHRVAKKCIYSAFVEHKIAPAQLIVKAHENYFNSLDYGESFCEPTLWTLSNSIAESFKVLSPMHRYKASEALCDFLDRYSRMSIAIG